MSSSMPRSGSQQQGDTSSFLPQSGLRQRGNMSSSLTRSGSKRQGDTPSSMPSSGLMLRGEALASTGSSGSGEVFAAAVERRQPDAASSNVAPKESKLPNPWNQFERDNKGKGLSTTTMAKIYRYEKDKNKVP